MCVDINLVRGQTPKSVLCPRQLCHTDTVGCLSSVMPISEEVVPCLICNY